MPFKPALGISDFRKLREEGAGYVDKTDFIAQLLEESTQVVLFPRPRRFGKTINLSALRYFLEKRPEDHMLFELLDLPDNDLWDIVAGRSDAYDPRFEETVARLRAA